jgi:polar amino acid transport system substrate-binding protein
MSIRAAVQLVLCSLLLSAAARAAESGEPLRLGADVWPPFTDVEGKARVAIDLVHEALRRGGFTATTEVRTDFSDVVEALRSGELDGSPGLWQSPEREAFLLFSRPYLENRLVLVGLKGSDIGATSLADLADKRVAVVATYAYGETVRATEGPRFVEGGSDGDNLQSLLRGEVDYVLADELLVHHLFAQYEAKAQRLLQFGTRPLATRSLHFALRRDHPKAAQIVAAFDTQIRRMITDGSYNRILQMDWIQADVDGDGKLELILGGREAGTKPPLAGYEVFATEKPADGLLERLERVEVSYFIAGQKYDDWEEVPPEYKIPPKHALEHGMETGRPGILLFEF